MEPRHKGVGLLAIVKGLKANPLAAHSVPPELQHYLTDVILPTGWYPERDYNVLIDLLARSIDRRQVGGNVWRWFGKVAAQRDIAGQQRGIPAASRTENAGIYRRFGDGSPDDVPGLFGRIVTIWSLYHDTGALRIARHSAEQSTVVMRLNNFHFPHRGHIDLQTGFMVEYARLLGAKVSGHVQRSPFDDGHNIVEWHYRVEPSAQGLMSLGMMPCEQPERSTGPI